MTRQISTHDKAHADLPNWSRLLSEAVEKPGLVMKAYSAFYQYSVGNQLLALFQCEQRGIEPGPINTYQGWQGLRRFVRKGERALILCMPLTRKSRDEETNEGEGERSSQVFTSFAYKPRWFTLSQTEGEEMPEMKLPDFDFKSAQSSLDIKRIPFDSTDGNTQGYARRGRQIAINPIAQLPHKTFFHETAHVVLGHTAEADFTDSEWTPRNLREVEAESVAFLCCESLGLDGAAFCRGYIQAWLKGDVIPEQSAQKIFRAADLILRAGRISHEPVSACQECEEERALCQS